jgi:Flp pilus assembly secretin CpaC
MSARSLVCLGATLLLGLLSPSLLAQVPPPPTLIRTPPVPSAEPASAPTPPPVDRVPPAPLANPSLMFKIQSSSERLELTVKESRILTMDQKIPQAEVANPDILELTPLSPNQIQIWAKSPGITKVNLWDEEKRVSTVIVTVYPDVKQLEMTLHNLFPTAALKVTPVNSSVAISGYVEQSQQIERIVRAAEEFCPKVLNHMTVGGTQQVLLRVKGHGGLADQAAPTGVRLGQDHRQQHDHFRRDRFDFRRQRQRQPLGRPRRGGQRLPHGRRLDLFL